MKFRDRKDRSDNLLGGLLDLLRGVLDPGGGDSGLDPSASAGEAGSVSSPPTGRKKLTLNRETLARLTQDQRIRDWNRGVRGADPARVDDRIEGRSLAIFMGRGDCLDTEGWLCVAADVVPVRHPAEYGNETLWGEACLTYGGVPGVFPCVPDTGYEPYPPGRYPDRYQWTIPCETNLQCPPK